MSSPPERIIIVCKDGSRKIHILPEKAEVTRLQATWFESPPGRRCTVDFEDDACWVIDGKVICSGCGISRTDQLVQEACQFENVDGTPKPHHWVKVTF